MNHQLNSSAEEIIQELSEEEDCDRSGDLSDQSDEQSSKVAARLDRSVKATDFSEDSNKIAVHFERDDPKYNIDIARKLFHGPNAISMQDLSSEENMKKLYNTFFRQGPENEKFEKFSLPASVMQGEWK